MKAKRLSDLLRRNDRVAVSNITGREASKVVVATQRYCGNIVGGWALGKGGQSLEYEPGGTIPVFATFGELVQSLSKDKVPNKVVVYSPPDAVYGEVKEILSFGSDIVETIFIITEHVSIEVTAKVAHLAREAGIDVIGCNTLGMINVHDAVRVGAVGGDAPSESFRKGSATIISNSGNMVTTMATYLLSAGIGTSFGISTGKDVLILTPLKEFLKLAAKDERTRLVVLYVEPGGVYEKEAVAWMEEIRFSKPVVVYVTGRILESRDVSLGHAGAVVEGRATTASAKMELFDRYFGTDPFDPQRRYEKGSRSSRFWRKGIRIETLHHLPLAAALIYRMNDWERDFVPRERIRLNPWFVNLGDLGKRVGSNLVLPPGVIPEPYASQFSGLAGARLGKLPARRNMRNASYASGNDGISTTIYGIPLTDLMRRGLAETLILQWTGEMPRREFETRLLEMCVIASVSNGPGTISAQGAKLSASAGNLPHTGMIAALASIGTVHGGNGKESVEYLLRIFGGTDLSDPYQPAESGVDLDSMVLQEAERFRKAKAIAVESGLEYEKIPCLGHPVFRDQEVNYDPREQVIASYLKEKHLYNVFLDFYHRLAHALKKTGATSKVLAVNLDAALACVCLALCWESLKEKRMTLQRAASLPFVVFALGRAAGAAGEFLDHQDHGTDMDMRVPASECEILSRRRTISAPPRRNQRENGNTRRKTGPNNGGTR